MIATVTLNPALDQTMQVPAFAVGKTNRGEVERVDPGGKGINVAKAVRKLGYPVLALGLLAGRNGRAIAGALEAGGIPGDFVNVPGETRVNLKIRDPISGAETEINQPGFPVEARHLKKLEAKIEAAARRCAVMVFSGSLPPGAPVETYARFVGTARRCGARTILDAAGAALRCGIAARPDLVKPNRAEAEELLGEPAGGEPELARAVGLLLALGPRIAAISLGADGAVAASGRQCWRARPPRVPASSSIGAGDAMVAAFACAMLDELTLVEALRLATAAGAATAAMSGSSVAGREMVYELLPQVEVNPVAGFPDAAACEQLIRRLSHVDPA